MSIENSRDIRVCSNNKRKGLTSVRPMVILEVTSLPLEIELSWPTGDAQRLAWVNVPRGKQ